MMTEREYLHSIGLTKAPTGRGRFSREAHAALAKARANGMEFKSNAPVAGPKRIVKSSPKSEIVKSTSTETGFMDGFLRYGKMDMTFTGVDSKGRTHVVSGRNACSCGFSLVGHICDNPTSLVGGGERIKVTPHA